MDLTHLDERGKARMVDVGQKPAMRRRAVAEGAVSISAATVETIRAAALPKGNPFEVARIAGIQAAKQTSHLIPLCHGLNLDFVAVEVALKDLEVTVRSEVVSRGSTGVEMEALAAVAVAALTIYDMCKAVDKNMTIGPIRLVEKEKIPA